jgi:cell division FtsZ-interacting protein ZapD
MVAIASHCFFQRVQLPGDACCFDLQSSFLRGLQDSEISEQNQQVLDLG